MLLNKNNFLQWTGSFAAAPFDAIATDDDASMVQTALSVEFFPLANDVATYGINKPSFFFTVQDNMAQPAVFNSSTGKVVYYLPAGAMPGTRTIKYKWYDNAGNLSNEGTITITVTARAKAWRAQASSASCRQVMGDNDGYVVYATLEEYYTDDNSLTGNTKANDIGDPDYVAPVLNTGACPLPGTNVDFVVQNLADGSRPTFQINTITFIKAGNPIASFSVALYPGNSTSRQVPADTYDIVRVHCSESVASVGALTGTVQHDGANIVEPTDIGVTDFATVVIDIANPPSLTVTP